MVKVDLITGFLGSGKTTFIKKYAQYLIDQGYRIGIIENDFGAVNVDIALERLNEAAKSRIKTENAFNNQYELASFLYTKYQNKIDSNKQLKLGNVELLFNLMIRCKLMTASERNG